MKDHFNPIKNAPFLALSKGDQMGSKGIKGGSFLFKGSKGIKGGQRGGSKGIDMVESGMHAFLSKKVLLFLWIVAKHAIRARDV